MTGSQVRNHYRDLPSPTVALDGRPSGRDVASCGFRRRSLRPPRASGRPNPQRFAAQSGIGRRAPAPPRRAFNLTTERTPPACGVRTSVGATNARTRRAGSCAVDLHLGTCAQRWNRLGLSIFSRSPLPSDALGVRQRSHIAHCRFLRRACTPTAVSGERRFLDSRPLAEGLRSP